MDEAGVLEGYVREGVFSNLAQCGNVVVERHAPPTAHASAAVKHLTTTCDIFVHLEVRYSFLYGLLRSTCALAMHLATALLLVSFSLQRV